MIRAINKDDIPACVQVIRTGFQTVADAFGFTAENAPRFTAFATTKESLLQQMDDKHRQMFAYFTEDGEIVGYYALHFLPHRICELNQLCVLPTCRHHGFGADLLNDAFQRARDAGCRKMNISIVEENKQLRTWYEYYGFVHTGTKKFEFFPFTCGYMEKEL